MTLQEKYQELARELDAEEYKLYLLKKQIQGFEAIADQIIDSAKKIVRLEEALKNIEGYMNQVNQ